MSLYVEQAGLTGAAAGLAAAGTQLAALATTPLAHAPLAGDEVSNSAAARLSEHGQVLASRAADAAAVLRSAAAAVHAVRSSFEQMDRTNATALTTLGGSAGAGSTPAFTPAAPSNAVAVEVPIMPSTARDGEALAALMEQGQSQAGQGFVAACGTLGAGFQAAATAARAAQATVSESLQGHTSTELSSALKRFGGWAESMATHSSAVAQIAGGHAQRFQTAQSGTPTTREFSDTKRKLAEAQRLNQRFGGAYSGAVSALQTQVVNLHKQAKVSAAGYHIGELPATPPPPPPVTPVVAGAAPQQPGSPAGQSPGNAPTAGGHAGGGGGDAGTGNPVDGGAEAGSAGAGLGPDGELLGMGDDPLAAMAGLGEDGMEGQAGGMAAALPSMLSGVLGGLVGAVTGIPAQLGQQVQSVASQAGQAVQGLTSGLNEPDLADFDSSVHTPGLLGGPISGGSGGGGGGTGPAAGPPSLPAAGGGLLAAAGGPGAAVPRTGATRAAPAAAGAAGGGGMPMMPMMPMAGMGGAGGGTRAVKDPDKTIHLPGEANSELVKGEVARRDKAVADDPTGEKKRAATAAPTVTTRRRIALPKDQNE